MLAASVLFAALAAAQSNSVSDQPLTNPVNATHYWNYATLPRPNDANLQSFKDYSAEVLSQVHDALKLGGSQFDNETTSFSINVFSTEFHQPILNYHFAAPGLNGSLTAGKLTDSTMARIGSVSKLLATYCFLKVAGIGAFQDSITRWIPELRKGAPPVNDTKWGFPIEWNDITLEALASHSAGLGHDADIIAEIGRIAPGPQWTDLSLPPFNQTLLHECNWDQGSDMTRPCSASDIIARAGRSAPIFQSETAASYSNLGFGLLGIVMERMTGKSLQMIVDDVLNKPLGTNISTREPFSPEDALIPNGKSASGWDLDLGDYGAAGSFYASTADLTTVGKSILSSSLLKPVHTRTWMRPLHFTQAYEYSIGAPWEIFRQPSTHAKETTLHDLYTKGGAIGQYLTVLMLDPDHGIGASVIVGGSNVGTNFGYLLSLFQTSLAQAGQRAAREQAATNLAGRFADAATNSSLELAISGKGMQIVSWTNQGRDLLHGIGEIVQRDSTAWLVATDLVKKGANGTTQQGFRVTSGWTGGYGSGESPYYNGRALSNFVVSFDQQGMATGVYHDVLNVEMTREAAC